MPLSLRRLTPTALAAAFAFGLASLPNTALADEQSLIKYPGNHPDYAFELEPHGLIGFGGPFGGTSFPGVGVRGTFTVVKNGFVKPINNSVGVGVGADFFFGKGGSIFLIPVCMQWNFWVATHWSVFGEPGLVFGNGVDKVQPLFAAGARYHFSERVALTLRVGYPTLSVGVSFLF